ncbi:unnamed protein product [Cunninghamella blakesleeana]
MKIQSVLFIFYLLVEYGNTMDISNYILVFNQKMSRLNIHNHIRTMYQQIDQHGNTTNKYSENDKLMNQLNEQISSIGNLHWYSGEFPTQTFENLFADTKHNMSTTPKVPLEEDVLHYWVEDVQFSLQEMVQQNPPSWGLDRIDQRQGTDGYYKFSSNQGQGVTVYILDTGINEDHDDISGRVTIGETIVGDDPTDNDSHGTFVAGVCCGTDYGVAKLANIVSVKTLDSDGNGKLSDLLKGLEWVVQQNNYNPPSSSSSSIVATSFTPSSLPPTATTIIPLDNNIHLAKTKTTTHPSTTPIKKTKKHSSSASPSSLHKRMAETTSILSKSKQTSKASSTLIASSNSILSKTTKNIPKASNYIYNGSSNITQSFSSSSTNSLSPTSSDTLMTSSSPPIQGTSKSIINLSLGTLYNQIANDAIEQIIQLGIHVTVAAGNYGEDACLYSPGSADGVVTVGAIDKTDTIAYYSNFGKCVDIFAPGTDITSISNEGKTSTQTLTGTSMAAPHVTGAMALLLSENDYTPYELAQALKRSSSLINLDFPINDTDGNPNKTVLDNAINMGYQMQQVDSNQRYNTPINVLFAKPEDGGPVWAFGGKMISQANSHYYLNSLFIYFVGISSFLFYFLL